MSQTVSGPPPELKIAIVGPCASGKTTLAQALQARGWQARQIVQEHSFVPDMWQCFTKPDILIYLDASYEVCTRRKRLGWLPWEHAEQLRRLAHARQHCHIYVSTDSLSPDQVLMCALDRLARLTLGPAPSVSH
jgi:deoxyadenosine/deoxycytidine kinase